MAPELMDPDEFGFTSQSRERLPSRGTDIYALGMTILEASAIPAPMPRSILQPFWQVTTGSPPFSSIENAAAVVYKVIRGNRPSRPSSGFSDLWGLLQATWLEENASQPPKRPRNLTIIDQLNNDAYQWQESIRSSSLPLGIRIALMRGSRVCLRLYIAGSTDSASVLLEGTFPSWSLLKYAQIAGASESDQRPTIARQLGHSPSQSGPAERPQGFSLDLSLGE